MGIEGHTITWRPSHNDIVLDASMDVRVHPLKSDTVVLILPGVDGSVDGYEGKYVHMAKKIVAEQNKAVVRVSNHFITSFHWEDNLRQALGFIEDNSKELFGKEDVDIEIIAHSAGSSVSSWLAWEYPNIKKMVLINMAAPLKSDRILKGLESYDNDAHFVYGSKDPSIDFAKELPSRYPVKVIEGADHYFSDEYLETFIHLCDLLNN